VGRSNRVRRLDYFYERKASGADVLPVREKPRYHGKMTSVTDLYRREYLGEKDILPPGLS
jgi:hypothetical protein